MEETTRYRFAQFGGGIEELDRFGVRDLIRNGEIARTTELAIVGSDEWKAADNYPELVRYFDLAGVRAPSGAYVPAPKQRVVESMSDRVVKGLSYPIAGGQVVTLILLAVFAVFPFIGILSTLAATFIMVDVVRTSANGKTKMNALVDTTNLWNVVRIYIGVFVVTLIALAPLIFVGVHIFRGILFHRMTAGVALFEMFAAAAFGVIYYPACLATVAVWDNVLSSLNPAYIFRVIRTIGADYFVVIAMWFIASIATVFLRMMSPLSFIPFVGSAFGAFLQIYVMFYAGHLLGYAVYRHAPELGWE